MKAIGLTRCLSDSEIEDRFRQYDANVEALKLRREELLPAGRSPSDYSALERLGCQVSGGRERVPEAQRFVEAEEADETIRRIRHALAPVDGVLRVLARKRMNVAMRFVTLRYREGKTLSECADILRVSPRSIVRIRASLLTIARAMFGAGRVA